MTTDLTRAIQKANELDGGFQNLIAYLIEREIESEKGWIKRFTEHPEVLEKLAAEARAAYEAGECTEWPMDEDDGLADRLLSKDS